MCSSDLGFVGYLSSYCLAWVSERVITDLRLDVLAKLESLSIDYFNRATMGDLLGRVQTDTLSLHRCLSLGFSDLVKEPVTIIALMAGLFIIEPSLSLFVLIFLPLCGIPLIVLGKKIRRSAKQSLGANISQHSLLVEAISAIRIVKAFGLEIGRAHV